MAYLTINFEAYKHNLQILSKKAGGVDKLFAVFKDNAYGHGLEEMSPLAAAVGIKRAVAKDIKEALKIKPFFQKVLILIEPYPENSIVHDKLIYTASDLSAIEKFNENTKIHLKVDTGMGRNGIMPKELKLAFETIKRRKLNLCGVFTHFYSADMVGSDFYVQEQIWKKVKNISIKLAKEFHFDKLEYHSKNSAALLRSNQIDDEFSRVGIATYGYTELHASLGVFDLKPVLSLWTQKLSTRTLNVGDKVGYGGCFVADKKMQISTYDIGYGDGFFRLDGKKSLKTQDNKRILGRLSMDCISIEGADKEVCIFSDVKKIAQHFETISYEILVKMSPFLKKIVIH